MTELMTRKQYAHSLGLANLGRGRMSREAHEAIAKAEAGGMQFAETKPPRNLGPAPKPREVTLNKGRAVAPVYRNADDSGLTFEAPRTYGDETFWTYVNDKGRAVKVDGRQVCIPCGFSLFWHRCSEPSAVTADGIQPLTVHLG